MIGCSTENYYWYFDVPSLYLHNFQRKDELFPIPNNIVLTKTIESIEYAQAFKMAEELLSSIEHLKGE